MVYLTTFTIQNQVKVGKYTSPMDHMGFRLFLHANDLREIFLHFNSFLPFRADSVKVPTMFCFTLSTGLSGQKIHPVLKGFTSTSIHPFTHRQWKVATLPPFVSRIAPKPWKTSLVSSNITSRGKVSVAKNDFLETPGPG